MSQKLRSLVVLTSLAEIKLCNKYRKPLLFQKVGFNLRRNYFTHLLKRTERVTVWILKIFFNAGKSCSLIYLAWQISNNWQFCFCNIFHFPLFNFVFGLIYEQWFNSWLLYAVWMEITIKIIIQRYHLTNAFLSA